MDLRKDAAATGLSSNRYARQEFLVKNRAHRHAGNILLGVNSLSLNIYIYMYVYALRHRIFRNSPSPSLHPHSTRVNNLPATGVFEALRARKLRQRHRKRQFGAFVCRTLEQVLKKLSLDSSGFQSTLWSWSDWRLVSDTFCLETI